jgi:CubicO group peptidase (beta-lactamase class C family)
VASDERLAVRVGELLGPRHPVFAAATVASSAAIVASMGADLHADFEIASVSKGITGLLYVDALARGEISRDSTPR